MLSRFCLKIKNRAGLAARPDEGFTDEIAEIDAKTDTEKIQKQIIHFSGATDNGTLRKFVKGGNGAAQQQAN